MSSTPSLAAGRAAVGLVLALVATAQMPLEAALTVGTVDRLTRTRETDFRPSWAPDGSSLVFVSGREGGKNLWIRRFDTDEIVRATDFSLPTFADQPDWSPLAPEIVFTSNRGATGSPDIWVLNLDTNQLVQLTSTPGIDWMPAFSPDGQQIAFVSDRSGADSIWIMNRDGSEPHELVEHGWDPVWSPSGTKIAYQSLDDDAPGVALVSASGGEPVVVAPEATGPAWSPDGRRLCAIIRAQDRDELRIFNADGTGPVALPQVGQSPQSPAWSRDGTRIAYDAEFDGRRRLFVVTLDYQTPQVRITSPTPGAQLQGTVEIRGTIAADYAEMDHAVVEVAAGTAPTAWTQVGDTLEHPVDDAVLATWDVDGLTGAYTIRVTAVDAAGDAGTAQVQVHALSEHGVEFTEAEVPSTMTAGELYSIPLVLKNLGTMTWLDSGHYEVRVGYRWMDETQTVVIRKGLLTKLPQSVESGASVALEAQVKAPPLPGTHILELDLRQGDMLWFSDRNALTRRATVTVTVPLSVEFGSHQTPKQMTPGQEYTVPVSLTNSGAGPLSSTGQPQVLLGYHWLEQDGTLLDHVPELTELPTAIMPEDQATVAARVRAPEVAGTYQLQWDLLIDEERWLTGANVDAAQASVTVKSLDAVTYGEIDVPSSMAPGQIYVASLSLENTGLMAWDADGRNAVRVGYHWVDADGSTVQQTPLLAKLPYAVPTGKSLVIAAQVQAPAAPGEYVLEWDLLKGEDHWFSQHGSRALSHDVLVARPTYEVQFTCNDHPASMIVGQPYMVNMTLKNLGTLTWSTDAPHAVQLGYHWLDKAGRTIAHTPMMVPIPQEAEFTDTLTVAGQVRAPEVPGQYTLQWDLHQEGKGWFSAQGANTLNVPVRVEILYGVDFASHDTPANMMPSQRYTVHLRLRNLGVLKWEAQGAVPVQLCYRWLDQNGTPIIPQGMLTNLPADLGQGGSVDLQAQVQAPAAPGTYILKWDLLQGGLVWFADKGAKPLEIVVQVGG